MGGTTPNYGWPYPNPPDYVNQGAVNFHDLATAIDGTVGVNQNAAASGIASLAGRIAALEDPPRAKASRYGNQSIANNINVAVTHTGASYQSPASCWKSSEPHLLRAPKAGIYNITGSLTYAGVTNPVGARQIKILTTTGNTYAGSETTATSGITMLSCSVSLWLETFRGVYLAAYQSQGSAVNINFAVLTMDYVGPLTAGLSALRSGDPSGVPEPGEPVETL